MQKNLEHKTAILIFANSPEEDGKQKRIAKSDSLFSELNRQTLLKVEKTKLPFFQITQEKQSGRSFGERIVNAIQHVYDSGFDNVIAIGNDSPQLKTTHLLETNANLAKGKTVIGPAFDGGFYLLGLNRTNFNASLFKRLPWKLLTLFTQLSSLFESKQVAIHRLETLHDIDSKRDIEKVLNHTKSLSKIFLKFLASFCKKVILTFKQRKTSCQQIYSSSFFNKGSPYSALLQ